MERLQKIEKIIEAKASEQRQQEQRNLGTNGKEKR